MGIWLKRYKTLLATAGIILLLVLLVHMFRSGYILARYWKQANTFADWLFSFLTDWAIVLSASITLLLAVAAFMTLVAMNEQRRKSVEPSLQIGKISRLFHHFEIKGTVRSALAPGIELQITNLGSGPALNLEISATAVIKFGHEANAARKKVKLHFKLPRRPGEYFLERLAEPAPFRLNLTRIEEPSPEDKEDVIEVKLKFCDMNRSPFTDIKLLPVPEDLQTIFVDNKDKILPGDDDYPTHLLPP